MRDFVPLRITAAFVKTLLSRRYPSEQTLIYLKGRHVLFNRGRREIVPSVFFCAITSFVHTIVHSAIQARISGESTAVCVRSSYRARV